MTRPGGQMLIAWHGDRHSSRIARLLALQAEQLIRIEGELSAVLGDVSRHHLDNLTVFDQDVILATRWTGVGTNDWRIMEQWLPHSA